MIFLKKKKKKKKVILLPCLKFSSSFRRKSKLFIMTYMCFHVSAYIHFSVLLPLLTTL